MRGTATANHLRWTDSASEHLLYSDFQLEQGSTATEYSETMGVYYPDHPRTDGVSQPGG